MHMISNNNNKKIQKACLRGIILHPSTEFKLGNNLDDLLILLPTVVSLGSPLNTSPGRTKYSRASSLRIVSATKSDTKVYTG